MATIVFVVSNSEYDEPACPVAVYSTFRAAYHFCIYNSGGTEISAWEVDETFTQLWEKMPPDRNLYIAGLDRKSGFHAFEWTMPCRHWSDKAPRYGAFEEERAIVLGWSLNSMSDAVFQSETLRRSLEDGTAS